jgi:hypothetical protein
MMALMMSSKVSVFRFIATDKTGDYYHWTRYGDYTAKLIQTFIVKKYVEENSLTNDSVVGKA